MEGETLQYQTITDPPLIAVFRLPQEEAYIAGHLNRCPVRAARIFKDFKDSSDIYSELPTKQYTDDGLSTIKVPLPMEGEILQYQTLTDTPLIKKEILQRNICHFRQAENTPLEEKDVIDKIGFGATTKLQMKFWKEQLISMQSQMI